MAKYTNLFVYGTLKKHHTNNRYLRHSEFICEAATVPGFALYAMSALSWITFSTIPCLVESDYSLAVRGELYRVNERTLAAIDKLEGHPTLYQRKPIKIADFDEPVEGYFWPQDRLAGKIFIGSVWPVVFGC